MLFFVKRCVAEGATGTSSLAGADGDVAATDSEEASVAELAGTSSTATAVEAGLLLIASVADDAVSVGRNTATTGSLIETAASDEVSVGVAPLLGDVSVLSDAADSIDDVAVAAGADTLLSVPLDVAEGTMTVELSAMIVAVAVARDAAESSLARVALARLVELLLPMSSQPGWGPGQVAPMLPVLLISSRTQPWTCSKQPT